ncbi:beta-ketoacyl-[acyl-carrier-protein] synthase family protein [Salinispora vitiensis]|uniref:beta-ketoacyl-[acyl-carrier-protein] synthase family protein n=1 Tax=Salinispora vitiensis TaxID=999544 RepID=UPI00037F5258|nr:beta-ketoacyl-[acyl-carrier-protein] synthase family protein [Salinispora vitiensis]
MTRRVVITGLGPVSSIGIGTVEFGAALRTGRTGISPITSFDASGFPHFMAGEVQGFEPTKFVQVLDPSQWGRTSLFAASAARLAVEHAGMDPDRLAASAAGSSIGTTSGESQVIEHLTEQSLAAGFTGLDPALVRQVPASRLAHAVNRELGLTGEATTISTACAASNYALGYAYDLISSGELDYMLAGGADSVIRWAHAGFYRLGALTAEACAPFSQGRSGILTGEGGAVLFLESLDSAVDRGAEILAEILGYGLNCDANHMVAPDSASIAECMRLAHRNAGITAADVDYICAHGTGTPANDSAEARAVVEVFEQPPPISSIKSMLGHTMGAASGFGAIASVLGMTQGFIPPTMNFTAADPDLPPIDPVANRARTAMLRIVQNNGFAFGGNNAIVIFGRAA